MSRKILSPSSSLPPLAQTITHPAARYLCDSWASCFHFSRPQTTWWPFFTHRPTNYRHHSPPLHLSS